MQLFLIHCGYYDPLIGDGLYESHVNFFVGANDFQDARIKDKQNPLYQERKMHIDGLQLIEAIDGYRISLAQDEALEGKSKMPVDRYRGLAPRPASKNPSLH